MNKSFVSFLEFFLNIIAEITYINNWKLNPFSAFNCHITFNVYIQIR